MEKPITHPNILCFVTDQQRADHLGCSGNPDVKTPHIDRLAAEGVQFTNSFVTNPTCSPNRACMFTGQYPRTHRLREIGTALPADAITLPLILRENGYTTHSSGKLHLAPYGAEKHHRIDDHGLSESKALWDEGQPTMKTPYFGLDSLYFVGGHGHYNFGDHRNSLDAIRLDMGKGYRREHAAEDSGLDAEVWCSDIPEEHHYNTMIADETIRFLKERDPDKPFFSWCSFPDPHHPFSPPEPWYSMYDPKQIHVDPIPPEDATDWPEKLKTYRDRSACNPEALADEIAKNYGMISMVDHNIGRVVEELETQGILEDTLILFFSDHGDYMGDHGISRKALLPYDSVYWVPTIYRFPARITARGAVEALHSTVDLMPTILDLAGIDFPKGVNPKALKNAAAHPKEGFEIPAAIQGVSQLSVLTGGDASRDQVYAELDSANMPERLRTIRTTDTMLTYFYGCDYGMLFDLKEDPEQMNNLFYNPEYAELRGSMMERLSKAQAYADPWDPVKICHA